MDTIAAIATPISVGGISVIRISGNKAFEIAEKVFKSVSNKKVSEIKGYSALFGHIFQDDKELDEVVLLKFCRPKSYTGEDVIEISCHGGIFITEKILTVILKSGARLAKPGEFTKRAFENGKLDLIEAEAVSDIISAESEIAYEAALSAKNGALSKLIHKVTEKLLSLSANISAYVDYPDDDIPELNRETIILRLEESANILKNLLLSFSAGQIYKEGINTVIAGRPNVGKSTLMNMLAGYEKAIVTDIAGTTRDVIEETVMLDGIKLRLSDTAGIRESSDSIEKIGIERARQALDEATLVIAVFDNSEELTDEDKALIDSLKGRKKIGVINKTDKESKLDADYINRSFEYTASISAKSGGDENKISAVIKEMYGLGKLNPSGAILASVRQKEGVQRAYDAILQSLDTMKAGFTPDAMSVDVDIAINALFELTGEKASDLVTETIFAEFCVGK